jgi:membrane-associated phospholipid phosphatase
MMLLVTMVLGTAVVFAALGAWAATLGADAFRRRVASPPGDGVLGRLAAVHLELRRQLGSIGAFLAVLLAGLAAIVAVCWPLGRLAKRSLPLDISVFHYFATHHSAPMTSAMNVLTQMGNRWLVQDVIVVVAVVLGVLWRRRRWVPAVVLVTSYAAETSLQDILGKVVDRGHPPTDLGTFPSGGCARLIAVYGIVWLLVLLRAGGHHPPRRGTMVAGWTVLGVAAAVEGFSRIYLLKHWSSDVVGGWVFGVLLLGVLAAATAALCPQEHRARQVAGSGRGAGVRPAGADVDPPVVAGRGDGWRGR